jgi:beta-glucosidase
MKTNIVLYLLSCFLLIGFSCKNEMKVSNEILLEQKVEALLKQMTLDEKIGQMSQIRHFEENADAHISEKFIGSVIHTQGPTPGNSAKEWQKRFIELQKKALATRLGIPLLFGVDAVHGQNTFEGATIFPHNIGLGATNNEELVYEIAKITALESQATGFNWVFSPCVAIPYNEKWGRVYEAFSESTAITEKLTKASIKGHQGNLADATTVMSTAKHFVGDGATDYGVEGGETTLSDAEIQRYLLSPYKIAVQEKVAAVMASFNSINGISMHNHKALITDTLKIGMKFDGIVVSDWKAYSRFNGIEVVNAGVDVIMTVDGDLNDFQEGLKKAVQEKIVSTERIDDAVRRILRQKFRLGLFENPFPDTTLISKIGIKKHREIAKKAVRESLVLLKNDNQVLPISKEIKKIVVVGEHANNAGLQSGGWTVNWQGSTENYKGATTILEGIKKQSKGTVVYDKNATENHSDADLAIIVVGEIPYAEFFGDIGHESNQLRLNLTEDHQQYIKTYTEKGIKTLVILISGRPLVVTNEINKSNAFVAAWLPGSEGEGIAEVLFGDYNFKGKLPHSWPKKLNDYEYKYGPNFWDKTLKPLYEFGFGMTYEQ